MHEPPVDPWIVAFVLTLAAASGVTWVYLLARRLRRGYILPIDPRRPVSWGPLAGLLAVVFVLIAISWALTAGPPEPPQDIPQPLKAAERILEPMLIEVAVIGAAMALVLVFARPDLQDLGLPVYVDEFVRDVRIGMVAFLAAIGPVYAQLIIMRYLNGRFDEPSHHPMVEMVMRDPYFGVMLLASVAAVIIAPICEEISFRLLLQGWLEKWEDQRLGWREEESNDEARMTNNECRMTNDEQSTREDSSFVIRHSSLSSDQPPSRGVAGLPYGWAPILVSSLLFALAHFGYGPEPVPLFVLALILGYVYQRTHRIVPCIVTHALFNLVTMLALWRLVSLSPE